MPRIDLSALAGFDADGALQETAATAERLSSRRRFLRNAGLTLGGAVAAGAGAPAIASAASKGDVAILNFALTLEYLESAFYASALKHAGLTGELKRFATTVHEHEAAHVAALKKALGSAAVKRPNFDFGATVQGSGAFANTAVKLEDTGVMAYQGQVSFIKSQDVFKAAISIHPVEARHAAWIRNLTAGYEPAPASFNPALTKDAVLSAVTATGFIKS
jgi:rubrerythrin